MALEPIRRIGFTQEDRAHVENSVARSVEANPDKFIAAYVQDPRSFGGRYVAADLFKETFAEFKESPDSRNRYNAPVHNSAAVLSAELFRRNLADKTQPERDTVVFLTGSPGAGKTRSVFSNGELPPNYRTVFEGQLSNPVTTIDKIQQTIDAGLKPVIIAVHARPENALDNTLKRFTEEGRGASINVMASIQGGLPASLRAVQEKFGDAVTLNVVDYRDRMMPETRTGWQHAPILESEGTQNEIRQRLSSALEKLRSNGSITEPAYRQASGAPPIERSTNTRVVGSDDGQREAHDNGPRISGLSRSQSEPSKQATINSTGEDRASAFLNLASKEALQKHPELQPVYAAVKAAENHFKTDFPNKSVQDAAAVMQSFRNQIADKLRSGELVQSTVKHLEHGQER